MLLGQQLRGRHQQRLEARAGRHRRSHRRNSGFAAAHVALEEAGHRSGKGQVAEDRVGCFALGVGEREGQGVADGAGALDVVGDRGRHLVLTLLATDQHGELHQEQLPEGNPTTRQGQFFLTVGEVDLVDGRRQGGQPLAALDRLGDLIAH